MKRILLGVALAAVSTSTFAAKELAELRAEKPHFTAEVPLNVFDIERCVIETVDKRAWVYRQPDRPNDVMLVWQSAELGGVTLLEMKGGTQTTLWFRGADRLWVNLQPCIGRTKSDVK